MISVPLARLGAISGISVVVVMTISSLAWS